MGRQVLSLRLVVLGSFSACALEHSSLVLLEIVHFHSEFVILQHILSNRHVLRPNAQIHTNPHFPICRKSVPACKSARRSDTFGSRGSGISMSECTSHLTSILYDFNAFSMHVSHCRIVCDRRSQLALAGMYELLRVRSRRRLQRL